MEPSSLPTSGNALPPLSSQESQVADAAESAAASRRDAVIAISGAAAYFLLYQLSPFIPATSINAIGLTTFLSLVLILLFTAAAARAMRSAITVGVSLVVSGLLSAPAILLSLMIARDPQWSGWPALLKSAPLQMYAQVMSVPGLRGLALVWLAVSIGAVLARMLREFKLLLPIGATLALVDLYVVFGGGLVTQAESGKNPVAKIAMDALTVQLPTERPSGGAAPMELAVGFADFLFIAMFFAAFARFGIPSRKTFIVMSLTLVAYMILVMFTGLSLPALIPIAVVGIGMNLRRFRYERSEAFALLYAGILVVVILAFMVFLSQR